MNYRKLGKTGLELSVLGFGCMRLPTLADKSINEKEAVSIIREAIDSGVNYLDTAFPYHDGNSEILVGKALKDGYREKTYIATKCPPWVIKCADDFDKTLDEQLHKLNVDYIDCYLFHALDKNRWNNVILKYNLLEKAEKAMADGKIRHIGFSFHDDLDTFKSIIDGYDKWEFCQIQLNYIGINHQAGIKGLEYAASKGLGVIIMEPLLGGKLANPPANLKKAISPEKTPVEWAFDFLWNRPEVSILLSGMGNRQQVRDNIEYASRAAVGMLSEENLAMLEKAKHIYDTTAIVGCTKCEYCLPCPAGIIIPKVFEIYNMSAVAGVIAAGEKYKSMTTPRADACLTCRKCEAQCPQAIKISDTMKDIVKAFA